VVLQVKMGLQVLQEAMVLPATLGWLGQKVMLVSLERKDHLVLRVLL
jgi:hypothetical protein